jgi:hypothetical protein
MSGNPLKPTATKNRQAAVGFVTPALEIKIHFLKTVRDNYTPMIS